MWPVHTMEDYLATERDEVQIHPTAWTNLENTMLSERSQSQKIKYYVIPFICNVCTGKSYTERKEISTCLGGAGVGGDAE